MSGKNKCWVWFRNGLGQEGPWNGGWVPHLPVEASELSTTTRSLVVVCRGGGSAGNNPKSSVFHLKFLMVPSGNSSRLTKTATQQIGNKKPVPKRHRLGDGGLQSSHRFADMHTLNCLIRT